MRWIATAATLLALVNSSLAPQVPEWDVGTRPALQIGAIDADAAYLVHNVTGVIRLTDGRIAILDASGLRYYNSDGRYLDTAARQGRGPGEYRTAHILRGQADTVIVWDALARNRLIIGPDATYVRSDPVEVELPEYPAVSFEFSDMLTASAMLSWPQPRHAEPASGEVERPSIVYKVVDLSTGGVRDLGAFPQRIARVLSGTPATRHANQPYSPTTVHGIGGGFIYIGDSATPVVQAFTAAGESLPPVSLQLETRAVTRRHFDMARARAISRAPPEARPIVERIWLEAPKPETFPYYDMLVGGLDGSLWVRQYVVEPGSDAHWLVVDRSGVTVGGLRLPARFEIQFVDPPYVAGVWRDEFDVEYMQAWEISR